MRFVVWAQCLTVVTLASSASSEEPITFNELRAKSVAYEMPAAFRVRQTEYADMRVLEGTFRDVDTIAFAPIRRAEFIRSNSKFRADYWYAPRSTSNGRVGAVFQVHRLSAFDGSQLIQFTEDARPRDEDRGCEPMHGVVYPQGVWNIEGRLQGEASMVYRDSVLSDYPASESPKVSFDAESGLYEVRMERPAVENSTAGLDTDNGFSVLLWVDPAKDFRIVREEHRLPNGYVFLRIERDLRRIGDRWLTKEQRTYSSCNNGADTPGFALFKNMHGELRPLIRTVIDSIKIEPSVSDATFTFAFPTGTLVTDAVSGATHRVGFWKKILTVSGVGIALLVLVRLLRVRRSPMSQPPSIEAAAA